jgi:UDP-N-acetyl-D-mannosaminouronate:lipid I N-acetyl-D-mannosaminouronosyltransferase
MKPAQLNGIKTYPFPSVHELITFAAEQKGILVAVNAEKIMNGNGSIHGIINDNIGYPDGIGAVWALRKKGYQNAVKLPGCELWLHIVQRYYQEKSFYLVGSHPDVINMTVNRLQEEFPGIEIVGYRDGYLGSNEEKRALIYDISVKKPDIVFVAMGSPKQELLMAEISEAHKAIYQGLGGSFDIYVGNIKRAPTIFQKCGLEWLYRLLLQPTRIKRQFMLLKFLIFFIRNKI